MLDRDFSKEELFGAQNLMKNNKLLGSDGFHSEFHKATWDQIGEDYFYFASEVFALHRNFEFVNQGFIKFIPNNTTTNNIKS